MKNFHYRSLLCVAAIGGSVLLFSLGAGAHEPEKHAKKDAQAPDCNAMMDMQDGKMDNDDPVVQAMMEQCKDHMDSVDHRGMSEGNADQSDSHGRETSSESSQHKH